MFLPPQGRRANTEVHGGYEGSQKKTEHGLNGLNRGIKQIGRIGMNAVSDLRLIFCGSPEQKRIRSRKTDQITQLELLYPSDPFDPFNPCSAFAFLPLYPP